MRAALADSIARISAAGITPLDSTASDLEGAIGAIRAHRVSPSLFGAYYEMVFALQAKRTGDARRLLGEIVELAQQTPMPGVNMPGVNMPAVKPFTDAALDRDMRRYARLLDAGSEDPRLLGSPTAEEFAVFESDVSRGLSLIEKADPALFAELRSLIVLIVGAVPPAASGGKGFGGASSFMLWGAVFLNIARHRAPLEVVEGLVHEAAHQLLFAFSRDDALVENAIGERFSSPLRRDPRPMIGVYHATFVCARVHYVCERLLAMADPKLSDAERAWIAARRDDQRRCFGDGIATVLEHGRLTTTGARIMDEGRRYMAAAA